MKNNFYYHKEMFYYLWVDFILGKKIAIKLSRNKFHIYLKQIILQQKYLNFFKFYTNNYIFKFTKGKILK